MKRPLIDWDGSTLHLRGPAVLLLIPLFPAFWLYRQVRFFAAAWRYGSRTQLK